MEVKNNPAGRLYDLLRTAQNQPSKESARNAWAKVFGTEPKDTSSLLKMLADIIVLVSQAKSSIERLEDVDHTLYLKPFKRLESFFSQINLDAQWAHWQNQLDEPTLYGLQFAADRLSRNAGSTSISETDLDSLRAELEGLVTSVLEADLPQVLKALFLRNLESVRHALLVYRIRGIDGLEEELERTVGALLLNKQLIPPKEGNSSSRKFWEKFFLIIDRINKAVTFGRATSELAGPTIQAIGKILDQ